MKYLAALSLLLLPAPALAAYTSTTVFIATNQARVEHHLPVLASNLKLQTAAQIVANEFARNGSFTHHNAWIYLNQTGYRYTYAGQNLARNFTDTPSTVAAWLNSPTHRQNLLSKNFTETGIALSTSTNGSIYVVQYFARPFKP